MEKTKEKNAGGRPATYPYINMRKGEQVILEFITEKKRLNARCAANSLAHYHRWRFQISKRTTDAGKFELTVKRVI